MDNFSFDKIPIVLAAALVSAMTTIIAVVVSWIKDRNVAARRIQALDEARRYVEFWQMARDIRKQNSRQEVTHFDAAFQSRLALAEELVEISGTWRPTRRRELLSKILLDFVIFGSILAIFLMVLRGINLAGNAGFPNIEHDPSIDELFRNSLLKLTCVYFIGQLIVRIYLYVRQRRYPLPWPGKIATK